MSQVPSGEPVENVEDLDRTEVAERLEKDPDAQRNREEMSRPDDPLRPPKR